MNTQLVKLMAEDIGFHSTQLTCTAGDKENEFMESLSLNHQQNIYCWSGEELNLS